MDKNVPPFSFVFLKYVLSRFQRYTSQKILEKRHRGVGYLNALMRINKVLQSLNNELCKNYYNE